MLTEAILHHITTYYLESSHFNGMPAISLADRMNMELEDLIPPIKTLIQAGLISVVYGDKHPNPYVRALQDDTSDEQIAKLVPLKLEHACMYPQQKHLESVVNKQHFYHRPYTLKLALGAPLYTHDFFDPSILLHYEHEPECSIVNDIQGIIQLPYTSLSFSRAVYKTQSGQPLTELIATSLEHLARLRDQDQEFWHSMSIPVECSIHPDVSHPLLQGAFRERLSVFEALYEEMMAVNELCVRMEKPHLFSLDGEALQYSVLNGYMVHPTLEAFNNFFLGLQVLLFQNMNPSFLAPIPQRISYQRRGKRTVALHRPSMTTLERLETWMVAMFDLSPNTPVRRLILLIKRTRLEISRRLMRDHARSTDLELLHLQRRLVWNTYLTIKWIRTSLEAGMDSTHEALHPLVRAEKIWVR